MPDLVTDAERLLHTGDFLPALDAFHLAEVAGGDPGRCSAGRWMAYMRLGDFGSAWLESDAMRRRDAPDPHRFWQGEDLRGARLMVRSLHGFGDAVQMLRYAVPLQKLAREVVYEVAPRFTELAPYFAGVERVITWGEEAPAQPPAWDVQCEVMELPYIFRTTVLQLPGATRYLHLPRPLVERTAVTMRGAGPRTKRVGLVWASGDWNPERSLAFDLLHPLFACAGFEFWNLQHGRDGRNGDGPMHSTLLECGDGLATLAATMANLDLVITVDTLAAHLAGALGRPAWLMLQHTADWRWMERRTDSSWYPSLRLFRQPTPGDWAGVIAAIARELEVFHER